MLSHRLFHANYTCLKFLAADKGGGSGGSPAPKPEAIDTLPKAKSRITELETAAAAHQESVATLTRERDEARTSLQAAETARDQNLQVATDNARERDEARASLTAAQGQVSTLTAERDTARTSLSAATTNVSRLEGLCNLRGINHAQLPPAASAENGGNDGEALYLQWKALKGSAKTSFYRQHEKALNAYADRLKSQKS